MKRSELEHAIRAACDVSGDNEVILFGSQAIFGQFPLAHADLLMSAEADVMPKNHPEKVDEIDGCLGEMSQFHETVSMSTVLTSPAPSSPKDGRRDGCESKTRTPDTRQATALKHTTWRLKIGRIPPQRHTVCRSSHLRTSR